MSDAVRKRAFWRRRPVVTGVLVFSLLPLYLIGWYLWTLCWVLMGVPEPRVDYLAKLNERVLTVPEEERGYPIYLEFVRWRTQWEERHTDRWGSWIERAEALDLRPGESGWEEMVPLIEEARAAGIMDVIRRGARKQAAGYIYVPGTDPAYAEAIGYRSEPPGGDSLRDIHAPMSAEYRMMARWLALDSRLGAASGDGATVVENIGALFGLSRHAEGAGFSLEYLIASIIESFFATVEVCTLLWAFPDAFDAADLRRAAEVYEREAPDRFRPARLTGGFMGSLDLLQRVYLQNGPLTRDGARFVQDVAVTHVRVIDLLCAPLGMDETEARSVLNRHFEESQALLASFPWTRESDMGPQVQQELLNLRRDAFLPDYGHEVLFSTIPLVRRSRDASLRRYNAKAATAIVIGLERYQRDHGAYPDALERLVPAYLPRLPVDVATGEVFRYVPDGAEEDGGPLLYSVGTDGEDNGGLHGIDAAWRRRYFSEGVDFVFWPPGREDAPEED